jgi:23S rRNA (adenine2030-N6)-methyltransferase
MDGYQGLKAFLPPKERRGLVFIDPPFERPNEFSYVLTALPTALKRFTTGIYAIWYPIKDRPPIERFKRSLREMTSLPILTVELSVHPESSPQLLNGSGMAIINPPWQLDKQIQSYLPWLWKTLSVQGQGQQRIALL